VNEEKKLEIKYNNLHVIGYVEDESERFPIKTILRMEDPTYQHIHGYLSINIADKQLPSLGFFGEDDVCFNTWIAELNAIVFCFSKSYQVNYLFDEGEQGQPAFKFVRDNDLVYISIIDSNFSNGYSNPDWQNVSCPYQVFDACVRNFLMQIKEELFLSLSEITSFWWQQTLKSVCGVCSHS